MNTDVATLALKVSIDGSRYVIRGIDKESSKKEILCIVAKYKSKERLPDLQKALSKLNSCVSIIGCKKTKHVDEKKLEKCPSSSSKGKKNHRKKNQGLSFSKRSNSYAENVRLEKKNCTKEKVNAFAQSIQPHRKSLLWRSHSLNEKDQRQGRLKTKERPNSFGTYDASKLMKVDQIISLKSNQDSGKNINGSTRVDKIEDEAVLKSRRHREVTRRSKGEERKLNGWLENLKQNSITYFIEDFDVQNASERKTSKINTAERTNGIENGSSLECVDDYRGMRPGKQCAGGCDYAEAETDSGLPSIDYESSLDTISRDERISLEQSFDEERMKERQSDSGFDCNSLNEAKVEVNLQQKCLSKTTLPCDYVKTEWSMDSFHEEIDFSLIHHDVKAYGHVCLDQGSQMNEFERTLQDASVSNEENTEGEFEANYKRRLKQDENENEGDNCSGNELFKELKYVINKISKMDEELLHHELLISQLEFQLDILTENIDSIHDIEAEIEEMKLISELKETEEFLKAITKLSQYQREAHSEIMAELLYLDAKTKERQIKLQSMERKLIRQKFKSLPRHLAVSKERRLYGEEVESKGEYSVRNEDNLSQVESDSISLV